jgi:uncharacterized protein (DUF362 family)
MHPQVTLLTGMEYDLQRLKDEIRNYIEIKPHQKVVLKPNWVMEAHLHKKDEWLQIITHPIVIEAVLDVVLEKLQGTGEIMICDSPMPPAFFDQIVAHGDLLARIKNKRTGGTKVDVVDLRYYQNIQMSGITIRARKLAGDPLGFATIDLGEKSEFFQKANKKYVGADLDLKQIHNLHNDEKNVYMIAKTILAADVFINLPKLKTHKLAGLTCSLKGLVGTVINKNALPHFTRQNADDLGDGSATKTIESENARRRVNFTLDILKYKIPPINIAYVLLKRMQWAIFGQKPAVRSGGWYGNDTIWRAILDLNKILMYYDQNGNRVDPASKQYFTIIDGIIAGDKSGPLMADRKDCGVILMADNPVASDIACAAIMGFDYRKMPTLTHAFDIKAMPLCDFAPEDVTFVSKDPAFNNKRAVDLNREESFAFEPYPFWKGFIEKE